MFTLLSSRFSQRGTSSVELALTMPLLGVLFLGIAQYGVALFDLAALDGAVRAALAYAAKNPNDSAGITAVAQSGGAPLTNNATVTANQFCQCFDGSSVSCSGSCALGSVRKYEQVLVSIPYSAPLNLPPGQSGQTVTSMAMATPPSTLSTQATMRIQ